MTIGNIISKTVGVDPLLVKKQVIFRPEESSDTLKAGYAVCYCAEATEDAQGRSTNPVSTDASQPYTHPNGDSYAEGNQNYTARMLCVQKPSESTPANLKQFAGIVCPESAGAGDGDVINIWVPGTGALIPVMTDLDCTQGTTELNLGDSYLLSGSDVATNEELVGIAEETVDRSGTSGLVWARLRYPDLT